MKIGKIIQITREYEAGIDIGEIQDVVSNKKYKFEVPTNAYKMSEEVNYAPLDKGIELRPMDMVNISKKTVNY